MASLASGAGTGGWLSLIGTGINVLGQQKEAAVADSNARSLAAQLNYNAGQTRAMAQRQAINERRNTAYLTSRAQALAAASGGSATDPTVTNVIGNIEGEGEYRALSALASGETQATGLETQARAARNQGSAARTAGNISSLSTVLSGASSFYDKYGRSTRKTTADASADPGVTSYDMGANPDGINAGLLQVRTPTVAY